MEQSGGGGDVTLQGMAQRSWENSASTFFFFKKGGKSFASTKKVHSF
jgi:hypothetical protein